VAASSLSDIEIKPEAAFAIPTLKAVQLIRSKTLNFVIPISISIEQNNNLFLLDLFSAQQKIIIFDLDFNEKRVFVEIKINYVLTILQQKNLKLFIIHRFLQILENYIINNYCFLKQKTA